MSPAMEAHAKYSDMSVYTRAGIKMIIIVDF